MIDLCASVFDWARFCRTKGAVKLHLLLDHEGFLPCYAVITDRTRRSAAVVRTFVGMQPTFRQVPPMRSLSIKTTRAPRWAATKAAT